MGTQTIIKKVYSRNEVKGSVINAFFREHMGINAPLQLKGYNAVFNVRLSMDITDNYDFLRGIYRITVEKVVDGIAYPIYHGGFEPIIDKVLGSQQWIKSLMREELHKDVSNHYFEEPLGMTTKAYYMAIGFEKGVVETLSYME